MASGSRALAAAAERTSLRSMAEQHVHGAGAATAGLRNWAGNVEFHATGLLIPRSVGELQELVGQTPRLRALGTGHSFSPLADTDGVLISTAGLPARVDVNEQAGTATVSSGLRYSDIAPRLQAAGRALRNLGSLPHISVGGAVATGTHGSGSANGSLATVVAAIELVRADGELVTVSRDTDPDQLAGLVVGLGAPGIVTALTLDTVPAFEVRQYVYTGLGVDAAAERFAEVMSAGYSVSLFTDFSVTTFSGPQFSQVWVKVTDGQQPPPPGWLGTRPADRDLHPISGMPASSSTPQLGLACPWHDRLPHFRPEYVPSAGEELQSEYLIAVTDAPAALAALAALRADLAPVIRVCEVRTVAADDLWLSPCYQRATAALHFTWLPELRAVLPVLARLESALQPFAPRPHWGKIFALRPADVAARYPRMDDFRALVAAYDPAGKLANSMVADYLGRQRR